MTEVSTIKNHLQKFGLNKNQAEVYVVLLRQGNLRISEIVQFTQLPRSSVYENLKGLLELGLVEEVVENSFKVIRAYPISSIKHHIDERIQDLATQATELEYLEKALEVLPAIKVQQPVTIRYYKGQAGARQLFWNTLKSHDTLYVQSEWGRGRYVGMEFYKKFVAESYRRGFQEHVLTNPSSRVLSSIRQHSHTPVSRTELNNIRCVEQSTIAFKGETLMYNNIYAHIFLKNEVISGFEIESQQFVDTQRAIFEVLWHQATPVNSFL